MTRRPNAALAASIQLLAAALVLILVIPPATVDAQAPAPAPATTGDAGEDGQPQVVSTTGGTFRISLGYLMVALLAFGCLYAVCRTSNRT